MDYVISGSADGILGLLFVLGQMMTLAAVACCSFSAPRGYTFPALRVLRQTAEAGHSVAFAWQVKLKPATQRQLMDRLTWSSSSPATAATLPMFLPRIQLQFIFRP
jgi:hypothetical protein